MIDNQKIIQDYIEGHYFSDISHKHKVSREKIREILNEFSVPKRKQSIVTEKHIPLDKKMRDVSVLSDVEIADIIDEFANLGSAKVIARIYRVNCQQLRVFLKSMNVDISTPVVRRKNKNYTNLSDKTSVICKVCGRKFRNLAAHIGVHNLTTNEYKLKFGQTDFISNDLRELQSENVKNRYENDVDGHYRQICSQTGTRNITKVNEAGLGWKMPVGYHTEEHKQHISELFTGRNITWVDAIIANHWTKHENCDEIIDLIVKNQKSNYKRGYFTSAKTSMQEYYHSSYEMHRMLQLDMNENVVFWTKKHKIRISYVFEEKIKIYIPDFLVIFDDGRKLLEEVKGFVKDIAKFDAKVVAAKLFCSQNAYEFVINYMQELHRKKKSSNIT